MQRCTVYCSSTHHVASFILFCHRLLFFGSEFVLFNCVVKVRGKKNLLSTLRAPSPVWVRLRCINVGIIWPQTALPGCVSPTLRFRLNTISVCFLIFFQYAFVRLTHRNQIILTCERPEWWSAFNLGWRVPLNATLRHWAYFIEQLQLARGPSVPSLSWMGHHV